MRRKKKVHKIEEILRTFNKGKEIKAKLEKTLTFFSPRDKVVDLYIHTGNPGGIGKSSWLNYTIQPGIIDPSFQMFFFLLFRFRTTL